MKKKSETEKYMATVKIGPKGQIVIPKEIRDMFSLESGDSLIIMADKKRGVAMHKLSVMQSFADAVFNGIAPEYEIDDEKNSEDFAKVIESVCKDGEARK